MMPPNRGPARGARIPGAKLDMRSARRLLSYLGGRHKAALAVVLVCILFSAVAGVAGSLFLEILIDDYISSPWRTPPSAGCCGRFSPWPPSIWRACCPPIFTTG